MGVTKSQDKLYFSISFGKIVRHVTADTTGAQKRTNKNNEEVWELIYDDIFGHLAEVKFREHPDFGNSWQLTIEDKKDVFVLQIQEKSRFCTEFLKKLPHLKKNSWYKFKPYDFEKNGKRIIGLNIYDAADKKIESAFQKFEGEGDSFKVTNLNGFPEFVGKKGKDGKFKKSDLEKYFIDVRDFLNEKAFEYLNAGFLDDSGLEKPSESEIQGPIRTESPDVDLPF